MKFFSAQIFGRKPQQNNGQQTKNCRTFNKGSTARQSCCNKWRNSQRRDRCISNPNIVRQNQNSGNRQQGQQSAIFNNDGNTQVGKQIGPDSAFNNQPGGKIILFGYEKNCSGMESNYNLPF